MDNADNANDGGQTWASSPSNLVRYDFICQLMEILKLLILPLLLMKFDKVLYS